MNLTHQHQEGVAAAVEAGVLPALVGLLTSACCTRAVASPGQVGIDGGGGSDQNHRGRGQGQQELLLPCRLDGLCRLLQGIGWQYILQMGGADGR